MVLTIKREIGDRRSKIGAVDRLMKMLEKFRTDRIFRLALLGDMAIYLLATIFGFLSHLSDSEILIGRVAATLIPFLLAWLIVAPWLGAYDPQIIRNTKSVWRVALAALYAAPIGAFGRSLWLNTPTLPLFVIIMAGVTMTMIVVWRLVLSFFVR